MSDSSLFESNVSERTMCGALMIHLNDSIRNSEYFKYYVDVEYNRNMNRNIKTIVDGNSNVINVCCDLIVHSRGEILEQDNLIAIEMKKNYRDNHEKKKDIDRLIALTKESFDGVFSADGLTLPSHVCRYILGVYYEIDDRNNKITCILFKNGEQIVQQLEFNIR